MGMQQTHLDRTEKFAEWLEARREELGVTRQDLYRAKVISESTYTKFVTIGNTRRRHGDDYVLRMVPKDQSGVMLKVLKYLSKIADRPDLVTEGLSIWGIHAEEVDEYARVAESTEWLGRIVQKLSKLPPDDLRTIDEIVHKFAMLA